MKYLSRPLKSMEDWIYGSLPWPKFTDAAKQLSVSSGKWSTALSPIKAFDFISSRKMVVVVEKWKKNPASFLFVIFYDF